MKWMPDSTGRFKWRPYYDKEELDYECERVITGFLERRYGVVRFPISTDDLSVMIEQETSDLDLYADLSIEGKDVEGLTEFYPRKKPSVKIARELSLDLLDHGRLRTTLAHEYGHVKFHGFLWDDLNPGKPYLPGTLSRIPLQRRKFEAFRERVASRQALSDSHPPSSNTFAGSKLAPALKCTRNLIVDAPFSDWMEWQAVYISGAILMPVTPLRRIARRFIGEDGSLERLSCSSDSDRELIVQVAESFDVSNSAASVRLEKLGFFQKSGEPCAIS